MTVQQVQTAANALAALISQAVDTFQNETGCIVHSLPVIPAGAQETVHVQVKVQIP